MHGLEALPRAVRRHGTPRMVTDLDAPGSQLIPPHRAYQSVMNGPGRRGAELHSRQLPSGQSRQHEKVSALMADCFPWLPRLTTLAPARRFCDGHWYRGGAE